MFLFSQIEVMKTNVESRIANFQQTLVKFIERWNALKPSNDLLESSDMQAIDKAISTIKEKRIEFDELDKERQNVMLACTLTYISFYIFAIFNDCTMHIYTILL